jgi:pyridoxal/pyridoxine/pyridoxamine kinase
MQQVRLTTTQLNRHEPFAHHTSEVGPGNQLLANITAFGEADRIQTIQVVLQGYSMACMSTHISTKK